MGDPRRDLVVIGASAGGVETLRKVIGGLPADLQAAVCVVLHIAPGSPSALAPILARSGSLGAEPAEDGGELTEGCVVVGVPDRHLVIEDGRVRLTLGARENGHRPAVDALFRSASQARGEHVVGVILSGTRDDGTAGLAVIKSRGGAAIVQDPEDALYAGMPRSALEHVSVDAVAPAALIASTIVAMVNGEPVPLDARPSDPPDDENDGEGVTTICPECGGVLTERAEGGMAHWQCRVGHRYSPNSLADAQSHDVEAALWAAIRALEDRERLLERMADQADARRQHRSAATFRERAQSAGGNARQVRQALTQAAATTLRSVENSLDDDDAAEEIA